jgi:hypothetical protein
MANFSLNGRNLPQYNIEKKVKISLYIWVSLIRVKTKMLPLLVVMFMQFKSLEVPLNTKIYL